MNILRHTLQNLISGILKQIDNTLCAIPVEWKAVEHML